MTLAQLAIVVDNTAETVKSDALAWPERAAALRVTDTQSYTIASEMLKGIKALRNRIADVFDKHISAAHAQHKALVKEKADAEAPLTQAEGTIKRSLIAYSEEQERIRKAEERRLAEIARKAEEDRRMAEAAALEAEALATGDVEMLATANEIVEAPLVAPVVTLPKATPTVSGISYREVWKFRVTNVALVPREFLAVDETKIGGVVRAMKGLAKIPGVEVYSEKVASASGR
jgi:hypothetical protein